MNDEVRIIDRISAVESSLKSLNKRVDNIEKLTKSVYELTASIKSMQKDILEMSERLHIIEDKPAKRWDLVISTLVTAMVSGIVGFLLKGMM